ncbi:hypothetical protein ACFWPY_08030 [Streptomyces sp. NPDC058527]|uniref:hypothetical protein n=1 Tax=unclassified Streptomyces TaxID=2593676 RepID=UPI003653D5AC
MRAFYRGYSVRTGRRAAQVRRLHIMREDGPMPGRQGECGTTGWDVTHSPAVLLDPAPQTPPAGLAWCPRCVGLAAARTGLLDQWAAQLAAEAAR